MGNRGVHPRFALVQPSARFAALANALRSPRQADRGRHIVGGVVRDERADDFQGKGDGGAGAAGGDHVAIAHHRLALEHRREFRLDRKMRRVFAAEQHAGVLQHRRGGADRGEDAARGGLALHEFDDRRRRAQMFHARAARQYDRIVIPFERTGQVGVGFEGDVAPASDSPLGPEAGDRDRDAGAAEKIDRRHGLDLFDTRENNHQSGLRSVGHGWFLTATMIRHKKRHCMVPMSQIHAGGENAGKQRLLVVGCGYIGGAVADAALARGWTVTGLTRNADQARALAARGVQAIVADLAEDTWHAQVSREQDIVLNSVSSGGGGLAGYRHSYVAGMRSLFAWAAAGVRATLVYTSSTSVYPQDHGEVVTEDSPVGPGGSEAAGPLLEAEQLVRESGCFERWFILRLAGIYGPGRHYLLDQLRAGATVFPGTGAHRLNLTHRDDIVSAILACATAPGAIRNRIFNVTDDHAVPKHEVMAWLAQHLGVPAPVFARDGGELPAGAARVRGRSGPVPDRVIRNSGLKEHLGWRPVYGDFRAGYRQIFAAEHER